MIAQLRLLVGVRELRLSKLRAELALRTAAFAEVAAELATLDEELAQIARQREAWERDWQHWLHQDRVIRHGQDYSLAHTALSAWERDARQAHEEVWARHEQAGAELRIIRSKVLKAEQLLQALREQLQTMERREHRRRIALAESRLQDEPRELAIH
jgi:septation ring formation regulator EzrA